MRNQPPMESMNFISQLVTGPAWRYTDAKIRVTYSDAEAAAQNKVLELPMGLVVGPYSMEPSISFGSTLPLSSKVTAKGPAGVAFKAEDHGALDARIERTAGAVAAATVVDAQGSSLFQGLDYNALWNDALIGVVRVIPPSTVNGQSATFNLVKPIEFRTSATRIPLLSPVGISATDGTLEDEVEVSWLEVVPGSPIRYKVFRDDVELTSTTGAITGSRFVDSNAERGKIYAYGIRASMGSEDSASMPTDPGHIPACRAVRLIGSSLNADMTAINGVMEQWACLADITASAGIDSNVLKPMSLGGSKSYRNFSVPVPTSMVDGKHTLSLRAISQGVTLNADRTYDIPFTLDRKSITVNSMQIIYNGATAKDGVQADSIGRFGIKMDGGSGIGFAEPVQ